MINTTYLIIGSGVAGLTIAVKIAEKFTDRTVTIITKSDEDESNTKYAQGGLAVVLDGKDDSFKNHIEDTLIAGDGLCDKKVVDMVISNGPKCFYELLQWGAKFDLTTEGDYDLGREGGHTKHRVVHHKDITGFEIERALLQRAHQLHNVTLLPHHFAVNLITEHQVKRLSNNNSTCYGAYVLNQKTNIVHTFRANYTILASGGIGSVYGHTTNPSIATGDGIAMAYRAKAKIQDMEFIQFHPTALYSSKTTPSFLISEAVRGFGALLRNKEGVRFMLHYDERAELASRDVVSQSIDKELKKTGATNVYLDCTHLNSNQFKLHFPNIYKKCLSLNINIAKDWIPVVPASHYLCGGIAVDLAGQTTIQNLFACGECSRTGLHGANRLASNSLLEALVYADNIFNKLTSEAINTNDYTIPTWRTVKNKPMVATKITTKHLSELQLLMRTSVGITRTYKDLNKALKQLTEIYYKVEYLYQTHALSTDLCELRNMVNVAHLIIHHSILRKHNKGGYYNIDNL